MGDQNAVALARGIAALLVALVEGGNLTIDQAREVGRTIGRGAGVPDAGAMERAIHESFNGLSAGG